MRSLPLCLILLALTGSSRAADAPLTVPANMVPKLAKITPEIIAKITEACPTEAPAKPQKPRKVLVFCRAEGFVHSSISVGERAFAILGERSGAYTATTAYDYDVFDAAKLADFDAVVLNSTTGLKIPEGAPRQALLDFVRNGKGVVGAHAATDNFGNFPEAKTMMGGIFAGHPWGAGGKWRFHVEDPACPITKAFDPNGFTLKDEIYQYDQKITSRDKLRYLVTLDLSDPTTSAVGKQVRTDKDNPVVWIHPEGKGRIFHSGFGHNNEMYWDASILKMFLAGIQYATGDLKVDDAPLPKK